MTGLSYNAQPISSRMPKPATAGPTTACQRDDLKCAGCNPLRSLANVPSQSHGRSVGRPRIEIWGQSTRGLTFTADLGCAATAPVTQRAPRHPRLGQKSYPGQWA